MVLQRAFAAYLRDPDGCPPPSAQEPRRLAIYRNAVFANIETFMADNYPRIKAVLDQPAWAAMVRDYLIHHPSSAKAFVDLPCEFLHYVEQERDVPADPPFIGELAHFDHLETLVGSDERRIDLDGIDAAGDLLAGVPAVNPIVRIVSYRFPVHAIDADYQPQTPPNAPTHIAAFRDRHNRYGFLDLNQASLLLLQHLIAADGETGTDILRRLSAEMGHPDGELLLAPGRKMFERLRARDVIVGVRTA